MKQRLKQAAAGLVLACLGQGLGALELPWESKAPESKDGQKQPAATPAPAPKPRLKIPATESSMFPKMKVNDVGGTTFKIDALTLACPPGWYRADKGEEDDEEAYLFACVPAGQEKPVCLLRIEYDINEMVRGAAQIPDFLAICRKSLEEDGAWKLEPLQIGKKAVQCLRDTSPAEGETMLLIQYPLKTYVPSIYVLVPADKAKLPAEAAAFIQAISQNK